VDSIGPLLDGASPFSRGLGETGAERLSEVASQLARAWIALDHSLGERARDAAGKYEVATLDVLSSTAMNGNGDMVPGTDTIKAAIAEGRDVWIAMFTSDEWNNPPGEDGVMGCAAGAGRTCDKFCSAPTCQVTTRQNELGQTIWACAARDL
jgi:hypothetical protein